MKLDLWEEEEIKEKDAAPGEDSGSMGMAKDEVNAAKVTAAGDFKCVICDLSFSSRKSLTRHYNKHLKANFFN